MTIKSPTGRLALWALQLQPFNLRIEYAPGKANVVADTLSRPPCHTSNVNTCDLCIVSVDLPTRSPADIREGQLRDEELKKIITCLETGNPEDTTQWTNRGYLLNQGCLFRLPQDEDTEEAQLLVPAQERTRLAAIPRRPQGRPLRRYAYPQEDTTTPLLDRNEGLCDPTHQGLPRVPKI